MADTAQQLHSLTAQVDTLKQALAVEQATRIASKTSITELVARLKMARKQMTESENARHTLMIQVETMQMRMQKIKAHIQTNSQLFKTVSGTPTNKHS